MEKAFEIDDDEFEEARRCLIGSYNSYIQNHAGLLIAVTIGGVALISEWRNFVVNGYWFYTGAFIFVALLVLVALSFLYIASRIGYWSKYADVALSISQTGVYNTWITRSEKYKDKESKPSCIEMIHYTAHVRTFRVIHGKGDTKFGRLDNAMLKFAIMVSRSNAPEEDQKLDAK